MRISILPMLLFAGSLLTGTSAVAQTNSSQDQLLNLAHQLGIATQLRGVSYLGVRLSDVGADRARMLKLPEERGVEVVGIEDGSPADTAGLKSGDVLLTYNSENVLGAQQFARLVRETPPGRKVKVEIWRDGRSRPISVTIGSAVGKPEVSSNGPGWPPQDFRFVDIPDPLLVWKNSMIGIECEALEADLAQFFGVKHGVLVRSVLKGSPADKSGLKAGDVITAFGDRPVENPHDLSSYLRTAHQPGKPIPLTIARDHKEMALNIMPSEKPE